MKRLYYFYYRKRYDVPCRAEIQDALDTLLERFVYIGNKVERYSIEYTMGIELDEIARYHNVTRERVRQCLWKLYRMARK